MADRYTYPGPLPRQSWLRCFEYVQQNVTFHVSFVEYYVSSYSIARLVSILTCRMTYTFLFCIVNLIQAILMSFSLTCFAQNCLSSSSLISSSSFAIRLLACQLVFVYLNKTFYGRIRWLFLSFRSSSSIREYVFFQFISIVNSDQQSHSLVLFF